MIGDERIAHADDIIVGDNAMVTLRVSEAQGQSIVVAGQSGLETIRQLKRFLDEAFREAGHKSPVKLITEEEKKMPKPKKAEPKAKAKTVCLRLTDEQIGVLRTLMVSTAETTEDGRVHATCAIVAEALGSDVCSWNGEPE